MRYGYGVYGERPAFVRGMNIYIVTLYRDAKPVHSWVRLSWDSALRKGAREAHKAERKDQR